MDWTVKIASVWITGSGKTGDSMARDRHSAAVLKVPAIPAGTFHSTFEREEKADECPTLFRAARQAQRSVYSSQERR